MKYARYIHFRARVLIEKARGEAANSDVNCEATLAGIAEANFASDRHHRRAHRFLHDKLKRQFGMSRRNGAVKPSQHVPSGAIPRAAESNMLGEQDFNDLRCPQPGDIVLFGRTTDGKGDVSEVPAIIIEVQTPGKADSRIALKTFEISHDMEPHRDVRFSEGPKQGSWRWRPER